VLADAESRVARDEASKSALTWVGESQGDAVLGLHCGTSALQQAAPGMHEQDLPAGLWQDPHGHLRRLLRLLGPAA